MCYILIYFHVLNSYTHFKSVPTASHRFPLTDEREKKKKKKKKGIAFARHHGVVDGDSKG